MLILFLVVIVMFLVHRCFGIFAIFFSKIHSRKIKKKKKISREMKWSRF